MSDLYLLVLSWFTTTALVFFFLLLQHWRDGRVVECGRLEICCPPYGGPGVRIPLSPPSPAEVPEPARGRRRAVNCCKTWPPMHTRASADTSAKVSKYWYVYILSCANGSTYTGCTSDLNERIRRHQKGHIHSTRRQLPVRLVCCIAFPDRVKAFAFEKYLKSGSGRAFMKKRLI